MPNFISLKVAVANQYDRMKKHDMFRMQVEKEVLWATYLGSFPEGTNPIFKERTEHDCQCCKSFIRAVGGLVAVIDGKLESIWDVKAEGEYQIVADKLSALVKSANIDNVFLHTEPVAGIDKNYQDTPEGVKTWNHFFIKLLPANIVPGADIGTKLGDSRSSKDVLFRSLTEITDSAIDTVLELIAQNSLYRGEEHKFVVDSFRKLKVAYNALKTDAERDIFCWSQIKSAPSSVSRIRNTVIGSLLTDLSEGKDLEFAVKSFETKVAPVNYKRPTALVTKSMVENAQKTVVELGLTSALERRYATIQDITVNNIIFADRDAKQHMKGDVFDVVASGVAEKASNFDKVEEIGIDAFIKNIMSTAKSVELMLENRHSSNLVSLVAPVDQEAKGMFKWPNNFSWSYTGEMTDSIKERVKSAGGNVHGDLRCSLSWFNYDDLDLHMVEPGGYEISFMNRGRKSPSHGDLDVDMNAGSGQTRRAVENICYTDRKLMKEGVYKLQVHNFSQRETVDVGFEVEVEFDGITHTIAYPQAVHNKGVVTVAEVKYSRKDGFEIIKSLPSSQAVKDMWGITTQSFHRVSVMMLSPNHWNEKAVGNKHYFFMLEKCINDGKARGFFNEFLSEELNPHRKVLEIVGSKMKTEKSQDQLSGIGFSSTQRNNALFRVKGNFTRVVKVIF